MNINLNNEKILLKNNFLFIKNNFYCKIKIPFDIKLIFKNNIFSICSFSYNKKNEISFSKLLKNLIIGIDKLWNQEILISGLGYKVFIKERKIYFNLGYSDVKSLIIPNYILIELTKNKIILKSVYKDKIGLFIYKILKLKKFDPYKKKGLFLKNPITKKSSKKKQ